MIAEQETRTEDKPNQAKKYFTGGFVALVIVFFAVPYVYTSNPASCKRCHEMVPYYRTWQNSMHSVAAKDCFYCHIRPGLFNRLYYRATFYREIYASLIDHNLNPSGATLPGTESCQRKGCHSLNRLSGQSGDIKIDHRHHVTRARPRIGCPECHRGASHQGLEKTGSKLPPRKQCKKCHGKQMANCSMCHRKKVIGGFKH